MEAAELLDVWPHMLRASSNLKNTGKTKRARPWGGRAQGVKDWVPPPLFFFVLSNAVSQMQTWGHNF